MTAAPDPVEQARQVGEVVSRLLADPEARRLDADDAERREHARRIVRARERVAMEWRE